jgi:hypothetical protein
MQRLALPTLLAACCYAEEAKEPIIQPPPNASSDMRVLGKQFLYHNSNRLFERYKAYDNSFKRKAESVEQLANVQPEPFKAATMEFKTGAKLDKGLLFFEVLTPYPDLYSEVNFIHSNTKFKLYEDIISTTFVRPFNGGYNFMVDLSTKFE